MNCFRYLNFTDFSQVDRLTIPEYRLLMDAVSYRSVDNDYRNHLQAYLNFAVKAEKKAGKGKTKPIYRKFKYFYNYEKELKKLKSLNGKEEKSRFSGVGKFLKKGG